MPFSLPNFNILVNRWLSGHTPAHDPPDYVNEPAQFYFNPKSALDVTPGTPADWIPPLILRLPLTVPKPQKGEIYQVDVTVGFWYLTRWFERTHYRFSNEYWSVLIERCDNTGAPFWP
jgi:hypothetical protein